MPNATNPATTIPFALQPRNIYNWSIPAGQAVTSARPLEEVRDFVGKIARKQAASDHDYQLGHLAVNFDQGAAKLFRLIAGPDGKRKQTAPVHFSYHGWKQFMRHLGGDVSKSRAMLERLIASGSAGEKTAAMVVNLLLRDPIVEQKMQKFRTVMAPYPDGNPRRVVRAVMSTSYAAYDNYRYLSDLLDTGYFDNAHVLSLSISDRHMTCRMTRTRPQEITMKNPIPCFDITNSPVGLSSVAIAASLIKLICTNGMTSSLVERYIRMIHSGTTDRLTQKLDDNIQTLYTEHSTLLREYRSALETQIDMAERWMQDELLGLGVSHTTVEKVAEGMKDETSSEFGTLANVVDGITLIAQNNELFDSLERWDLEKKAHTVLVSGLKQADNKRILVDA